MSSVAQYMAWGAAEAKKLNLMKATITRIIIQLNDGIEKQDGIFKRYTC